MYTSLTNHPFKIYSSICSERCFELVAVMVNFALVGMGGGLLCSLVGGYVIYADWRNSTDPMARVPKDLKDKVYLVTGANTGIGR